jgi:class 3 adenylate cyclase
LKAERSALWCAVGDTERLNRAIGLGELKVEANSDRSAARFRVRTVSAGFALQYDERPFEWLENRKFSVVRVLRGGLVKSIDHTFELESRKDGGTDVIIRIGSEPRSSLLSPILRLQVSRMVDRIEAELVAVDAEIATGKSACFRVSVSPVDEATLRRVESALRASLSGVRLALAERLLGFVRNGSDADVARIRPLELAVEWGVDGRELLGACLVSVGAGLLELRWDLVCPSCRTANERVTTLEGLPESGHCQLCDLSYDIEFDRAVEATFLPTPAVRAENPGPFCIGGPMRTPHVIAQSILPAAGEAELAAPDKPGRYRVFVRGGASAALEVLAEGAASARFSAGERELEPKTASVRPGAALTVGQRSEDERHVKVERLEFASHAATAHLLSTLPEFRRQFSRDLLRPGTTLRVARVALLFTDLTDSTALYSSVGDAKAFRVVQEHFDVLSKVIAEQRGTIVKTIGDAVMAAFLEERDALAAALAMQQAFPAFRAGNADAATTFLKIGVFAGACYIVTANGILDYFGQTVNVAARLQGTAGRGEIVIDAAFAEEAERAGWLGEYSVHEYFETRLKGLPEPVRVARLVVDRE